MFYVYIIKSLKNKKHYIGYTKNPDRRLKEHNGGENKSTKSGTPFKLIYLETHKNKNDAQAREREIKSYKGGNAFKQLVNH